MKKMNNSLTVIKSNIARLYGKNTKIHIDLCARSKRKNFKNVPAVITAVYPNIFTARLMDSEDGEECTFQYADVLTRSVVVRELDGETD